MIKITCRDNQIIKRASKLLTDGALRKNEGVFVCHGKIMLDEAIKSGMVIEDIFISGEMQLDLPQICGEVYDVTPQILGKISGVETANGVVFTCRVPHKRPIVGNRILALDAISDPGNMGTILRTADAFGLDGVFLLGNCVDIYSPKVVRATMGSLFRVITAKTDAEGLRFFADSNKIPLYAAALDETTMLAGNIDLRRACIVIGNEAHGVSTPVQSICDGSVKIPMDSAESLNAAVAAAIFMWEMSR